MYLSKLAVKSHTGEYIGVREYMSGDSPKIIHWKKSLRREDLEDVYVRLYAREIEKGGGRGSRVLYVDLTSTNQRELDLLVSTLYSKLLRSLSRQSPLINTHLFLKLPAGDTYYINGKLVDVTAALNTIIQKHGLQPLYNYQSWRRGEVDHAWRSPWNRRRLRELLQGAWTSYFSIIKGEGWRGILHSAHPLQCPSIQVLNYI